MTTLQHLARRLLASLSALLSTLPAVAMESVLVLLLALAFVAQKASAAPAVVHNAPVLKSMVLDTPSDKRLQAPPTSGLFARLKFQARRYAALCPMVLGVGAHTRKDCGMAEPMCLSPLPPAGLDSLRVVPKSRQGATMTNPQGTTTPTHHHTTEERRAFAALEAANCAALARWYSARGNVKAARRKAVQLLAALAVLEGVQHA